MSALTLVIANKSYSSWSLRPWLLMRQFGVDFEEIVIPLYRDGAAEKIRAYSPTGKLPCLIDGEAVVWESLAIVEHVAERFPDRPIWPDDPLARAFARSIAAEMHAGFQALRDEFNMNVRRKILGREPSQAARADVARIESIWSEARGRFGGDGPYLIGAFSAADAMFAPVATRFETYGIEIGAEAKAYVETILSTPAYLEWKEAALAEPWVIERYELA
ncbi:glutathione S-transferase family protein [Methylopila sp. M107]|uniref:glutathione S-transferase family protein n=1 Tax=Methylopila sp. M107 TaxID=1101190 RepID=UPI000376A7F8|nr:glutathione S-transferase family protein [Methylopila sp. M107]